MKTPQIPFLALGLLCIPLVLGAQTSTDFNSIRSRVITELMNHPVKDSSITLLLAGMSAEGTWPDINYEDVSKTGFDHARHLERLQKMALAYRTRTSEYHKDKKVFKALMSGLDHWFEKDYICENWWWNQIGVPNSMLNIMLIMDEGMPKKSLEQSQLAIGRGNIMAWGARPGGDRIKIATIDARNALLLHNEQHFGEMIEIVEGEIKFVTGRGMQHDYSFHHRIDRVNNTLSYGLDYADRFADWTVLLQGTGYQLGQEVTNMLIDYFLDGICKHMVYGRYPSPGAKNRSICRKGALNPAGPSLAIKLAAVSDYRKEELQEIIAIRSEGSSATRPFSTFFWQSEFYAHQRPGYYTSLRMYSQRNANMEEPYNGEGLLNHHRGDGAMHILLDGTEYSGIWPVFDFQKVPGTTVLQKDALPAPEEIQKYGQSDFTGAVSDGMTGAAAMDFRSPHDPLVARKAWFFFDEVVVCLGAGISAQSALHTHTTLNQCLLDGEVKVSKNGAVQNVDSGEHLLENVDWVHHDGVGYVPLELEGLILRNREEKGSWWRISHQMHTPKEELSREVFTLYTDHGSQTQNARYGYLVIPGVEAGDLDASLENNRVEILSNTPEIQAVKHPETGIIQVVFHKNGALKLGKQMSLSCDSEAMVMIRYEGKSVKEAWVSDPSRKLGRLHLELRSGAKTEKWNVLLPQGPLAGSSVQTVL